MQSPHYNISLNSPSGGGGTLTSAHNVIYSTAWMRKLCRARQYYRQGGYHSIRTSGRNINYQTEIHVWILRQEVRWLLSTTRAYVNRFVPVTSITGNSL